jgi:hypothetical protein
MELMAAMAGVGKSTRANGSKRDAWLVSLGLKRSYGAARLGQKRAGVTDQAPFRHPTG